MQETKPERIQIFRKIFEKMFNLSICARFYCNIRVIVVASERKLVVDIHRISKKKTRNRNK